MEHLSPPELVSTLLLLYMRTKAGVSSQSAEAADRDDVALYDRLDPTFLQQAVADVIVKTATNDTEVCALYLGLRRIPDFSLYVAEARDAVYTRLQSIGNKLSSQ